MHVPRRTGRSPSASQETRPAPSSLNGSPPRWPRLPPLPPGMPGRRRRKPPTNWRKRTGNWTASWKPPRKPWTGSARWTASWKASTLKWKAPTRPPKKRRTSLKAASCKGKRETPPSSGKTATGGFPARTPASGRRAGMASPRISAPTVTGGSGRRTRRSRRKGRTAWTPTSSAAFIFLPRRNCRRKENATSSTTSPARTAITTCTPGWTSRTGTPPGRPSVNPLFNRLPSAPTARSVSVQAPS